MNTNLKVVLLLALILLWVLVSWRWYTCGIKGFCSPEYKVHAIQDINN